MKIAEIQVGGRYVAKVSGVLTTVRVLAVREAYAFGGKARQVVDVVNERTGRRTTFRSAGRLRRPVAAQPAVQEGA